MASLEPFRLPSPLPPWPPGGGFASGVIDLGGGLLVRQVSSFNKICATSAGGPSNKGATFYAPATVPEGFYVLGHYGQPNDRSLHGFVMVAKADSDSCLRRPLDFMLVWSSAPLGVYIWYPDTPDGYSAVGFVVSSTGIKPSLDAIRCVRSDLTDQSQADEWIWGPGKASNATMIDVYSMRPTSRGVDAMGVPVGTFGLNSSNSQVACLKNTNPNSSSTYMPNVPQIRAVFQEYSPFIYFHPDEKYLPSSVPWYFTNGASLFKKGDESNPVKIDPSGSNLPQGGSNDGAFWIDLTGDDAAKEKLRRGSLRDAVVYLHAKPMFGGTFTDLAVWVFYPYNGPGRLKIGPLTVPLGKIGEHVGDWEHVTLRVSNFAGELWQMFCSQHSGGTWYHASELEFFNESNKPVGYSSLNGHAMYPKAGLVLQGTGDIGIRNDTAKSNEILDTGTTYAVIAAEYLGEEVVEPPWVNYYREWGPKVTYSDENEIKNVEKLLPASLKTKFEKFVKSLPKELLGEEGPTGPKVKANWTTDDT